MTEEGATGKGTMRGGETIGMVGGGREKSETGDTTEGTETASTRAGIDETGVMRETEIINDQQTATATVTVNASRSLLKTMTNPGLLLRLLLRANR